MQLPPEIVEIRNGIPMISSLKVAELFKKQHKNVLRSIEKLTQDFEIDEVSGGLKFEPSSYLSAQGKEMPMYWMDGDTFYELVMPFEGITARKLRRHIIALINKLEEQLKELARDRIAADSDRIPLEDLSDEAFWARAQERAQRQAREKAELEAKLKQKQEALDAHILKTEKWKRDASDYWANKVQKLIGSAYRQGKELQETIREWGDATGSPTDNQANQGKLKLLTGGKNSEPF